MGVTIRVPASLRTWFQGKEEAVCEGNNLGECIDNVDRLFPGFKARLLNEEGELASVLVFINGDNVTKLEGLATAVQDGDEIGIIPIAAGG